MLVYNHHVFSTIKSSFLVERNRAAKHPPLRGGVTLPSHSQRHVVLKMMNLCIKTGAIAQICFFDNDYGDNVLIEIDAFDQQAICHSICVQSTQGAVGLFACGYWGLVESVGGGCAIWAHSGASGAGGDDSCVKNGPESVAKRLQNSRKWTKVSCKTIKIDQDQSQNSRKSRENGTSNAFVEGSR